MKILALVIAIIYFAMAGLELWYHGSNNAPLIYAILKAINTGLVGALVARVLLHVCDSST